MKIHLTFFVSGTDAREAPAAVVIVPFSLNSSTDDDDGDTTMSKFRSILLVILALRIVRKFCVLFAVAALCVFFFIVKKLIIINLKKNLEHNSFFPFCEIPLALKVKLILSKMRKQFNCWLMQIILEFKGIL